MSRSISVSTSSSASGIACDTTENKFGPFRHQLFVGDQTHSTGGNYEHKVTGNYELTVDGNLTIKVSGTLTLQSGGDLTAEVREFVSEHIQSAEELDILLLLQREPERKWTALDVSKAIYTVPASATMRLERLVSEGLLSSSGGSDPAYSYSPASAQLGTRG